MLAEAYYLGKEVKEDNDKAFFWFSRALEKEKSKTDKLLLYRLGKCYFHGFGTEGRADKAFRYFKNAVDLGHVEAKYYTGWCYVLGEGVLRDIPVGLKYLHESAMEGNDNALTMLFQLYDDSEYVGSDEVKYIHYLRMGVERKIPEALTDWGFCLTTGDKGVEKNVEEGLRILREASDLGDANASEYVGKILGYGIDYPVDQVLGEQYLRKAIEQGNNSAVNTLGIFLQKWLMGI